MNAPAPTTTSTAVVRLARGSRNGSGSAMSARIDALRISSRTMTEIPPGTGTPCRRTRSTRTAWPDRAGSTFVAAQPAMLYWNSVQIGMRCMGASISAHRHAFSGCNSTMCPSAQSSTRP